MFKLTHVISGPCVQTVQQKIMLLIFAYQERVASDSHRVRKECMKSKLPLQKKF